MRVNVFFFYPFLPVNNKSPHLRSSVRTIFYLFIFTHHPLNISAAVNLLSGENTFV